MINTFFYQSINQEKEHFLLVGSLRLVLQVAQLCSPGSQINLVSSESNERGAVSKYLEALAAAG